MRKRYQCLVCNRLHDTLQEARECHKGPVQRIIQGFKEWPKSILGAH